MMNMVTTLPLDGDVDERIEEAVRDTIRTVGDHRIYDGLGLEQRLLEIKADVDKRRIDHARLEHEALEHDGEPSVFNAEDVEKFDITPLYAKYATLLYGRTAGYPLNAPRDVVQLLESKGLKRD